MAAPMSTRRAIILAATGAALAFTASSGNAQQVAANGVSPASIWPATVAECQAIADRAKRAQCTVEVGTAVNKRAIEVSNNKGNCADEVKAGIESGEFKREKLAAILAGRPAREVGACNILAQLKSQL